MKTLTIETSHATIAISDSEGSGPPLLMIHGNSSCRHVFRNQLDGEIGRTFRCIAIDLPGHGDSSDAVDPEKTYWMPGYADVAIEVMAALDIPSYAVLGWSLGGHIGLEMLARTKAVTHLMISGTPPFEANSESLDLGFLPSAHMHLAGQEMFSEQDISDYAHSTCGVNAPFEPFLLDCVARTDGRARAMMFSRILSPEAADQQAMAIHSPVPLAIVNGEEDVFINNDFIAGLAYENLWEGTVYRLKCIGHAPFWEAPEVFDPYLIRFLSA
ncbi:alpha/beta fold hydrolase [Sulfitobacter dubius]|uniref:AB hydrolase superfamily protein YvaM n=1 Tax=Sulfitobacter dubius TaxID=218673 RepID=A0ABY3ZP28_9RHOB|nr:alpha/beta hydrolase [Sulfitobacter dubius]UOA15885.1 AB hydrolase superfamily protein YvaM [Sulfitobacter dubius]